MADRIVPMGSLLNPGATMAGVTGQTLLPRAGDVSGPMLTDLGPPSAQAQRDAMRAAIAQAYAEQQAAPGVGSPEGQFNLAMGVMGGPRSVGRAGASLAGRDRIAEALAEGAPTLYHGTSKDKGFRELRNPRNGTWFSTDPREASQYAVENDSMGFRWEDGKPVRTNTAPRVIPMVPRFDNTLTITEWPEAVAQAQNYKRAQGDYFDTLRAQGYDSVRMPIGDGHSIYVSFDNSKLIPKYSGGIPGSLYALPLGAGAAGIAALDQYQPGEGYQ